MQRAHFNCNFIEITLQHGCSLVNLLNIFRIPFPKNASGELLLRIVPTKKKFTIPKLKLLRNFVLSNCILSHCNVVHNALSEGIVVANFFCWSDSSTALAWIKNVNKE